MVDIRQSLEYANYIKHSGWIVERIKDTNYFIKRLPLFGSFIKIQRPEFIDGKTIQDLSKKYKAFQIIIEPKDGINNQWMSANKYRITKTPYLPSKTLLLDLRQTKSELFNGLAKDAKNAVKKNKEIKLHNCKDDLKEFQESWAKTVGLKRHVYSMNSLLSLKKSFKDNSLFLLDKSTNSGAIFLIADKSAYYWQAFTSVSGRKSQVQYKIVWGGVLWAKKKAMKLFDFEGVFDPRFPDNSWLGFTHFKKSFGGYEVEFPGAFAKWRVPYI